MMKNPARKRCSIGQIGRRPSVVSEDVYCAEKVVAVEDTSRFDFSAVSSEPFEMVDLQCEMVALMQKADIRPELIYAYLTTGLVVTEENYRYLTPEDRRAWNRAVAEYSKRSGRHH